MSKWAQTHTLEIYEFPIEAQALSVDQRCSVGTGCASKHITLRTLITLLTLAINNHIAFGALRTDVVDEGGRLEAETDICAILHYMSHGIWMTLVTACRIAVTTSWTCITGRTDSVMVVSCRVIYAFALTNTINNFVWLEAEAMCAIPGIGICTHTVVIDLDETNKARTNRFSTDILYLSKC